MKFATFLMVFASFFAITCSAEETGKEITTALKVKKEIEKHHEKTLKEFDCLIKKEKKEGNKELVSALNNSLNMYLDVRQKITKDLPREALKSLLIENAMEYGKVGMLKGPMADIGDIMCGEPGFLFQHISMLAGNEHL